VEDVSALRGLPPKRPIGFRLVGEDRVRKDFTADLSRDADTGQMARRKRYWATVGLVPWELDLLAHYRELYGQLAAGYYEDEAGGVRVVLRNMLRSEVTEIAGLVTGRDKSYGETLAHEVVHALQDQHFDLARMQSGDGSDERNARRALVEGDAFLAAFQYDRPLVFRDVRTMTRLVARVFRGMRGESPTFVESNFLFPYVHGTRFVASVFEHGGWPAVNAAYADPPRTTAEVLHPDRYLARQPAPAPHDLSAVRTALAPTWTASVEEPIGELAVRYLLSVEGDAKEAAEVAAAWRGDRALVLERSGGMDTSLVWASRWKDAETAARFAAGYEALAQERGRPPVRVTTYGAVVVVLAGLSAAERERVHPLALAGAGVLKPTPSLPRPLGRSVPEAAATETPVRVDPPLEVTGYASGPAFALEAPGASLVLGGVVQYRVDGSDDGTAAHRLPRVLLRADGTIEPLLQLGFTVGAELSPQPDEPTLAGDGAAGALQDASLHMRLASVGLADAGKLAFGRQPIPLLLEGATPGEALPLSRRSLLYDRLLPVRDVGFVYQVDYSSFGVPAGIAITLGEAVQGARASLFGPREPAPLPRLEGGVAFAALRPTGDGELLASALIAADLALRWRGLRLEATGLLLNPGEDGPGPQLGWSALAGLQPLPDFLELLVRYDRLDLPARILPDADQARLTWGIVLHYLPGAFRVAYDQEWDLPAGSGREARATNRLLLSLGF